MTDTPWVNLAAIVGTTLERTVTVYDAAPDGSEALANLFGCSLTFRVYDLYRAVVLEKVLDVPSPASGEGTIALDADDLSVLSAAAPYIYDVRLIDGEENVSVVVQGGFSAIA